MKIVIVGGVAGGASCASRIRRLDENAEIVIFEKSGFVSYANCGLPYYIGDVITDEDDLTVQTPAGFGNRFCIDAKVHHEVLSVNPQRKTVTVKNLKTDEIFEETYDKLILATGAKAAKPNMTGVDLDGVFTIRTVEDTLKIKKYIRENGVKSASVIGGGFIGVEMAENLKKLGLDVTVIEYAEHLMATLDKDMASYVHAEMRAHGVKLMLNTAVVGFEEKDGKTVTHTKDGASITSDMVLLAIGVVPDTKLAKEAGLKLGIKDSILVNDKMETSEKDIYAVGDAVQVKNFVTQNDTLISLAGPANKQGRIAADNVCGGKSRYHGSQGSSVLKLFDRTVASTGINEVTAKKLSYNCESVILSPASHASYYPGGKALAMKVTFDKDTLQILGAQIVGFDGVDKRIDVIATAIRAGMNATELAELELAYAPPYSSAKDPVNMAGFIIENVISGKVKQFGFDTCQSLPRNGSVFLLDARTPREYAGGCADGFVNIPLDSIRDRLDEIPKNKPVYVMCQSGLRSYLATRILTQNGYEAYNFTGGYGYYKTVSFEEQVAKEVYPCGMEK